MTTRIGYCFDGNMIMSVNAIEVQGPIFVQQPIRPVSKEVTIFPSWPLPHETCF